MPRYISQLRRGWKWDKDPETGEPRDDWAKYTEEKPDVAIPLPGELVLEYDNGIPRLKIGDGVHTFAELEYMSVDSFILPKPISVTLYADKWEQVVDIDGADVVDTYSQVVEVENAVITPNSKVDLQPTTSDLCRLYDWGVALTTKNEGGIVTVYAVGDRPSGTLNIQATVAEIVLDEEVTADE
jgi:hypothetical protein